MQRSKNEKITDLAFDLAERFCMKKWLELWRTRICCGWKITQLVIFYLFIYSKKEKIRIFYLFECEVGMCIELVLFETFPKFSIFVFKNWKRKKFVWKHNF
jgi:hypothetical protein